MQRKVLITGGAGYIGSILAQTLLIYNYDVTVVDNFMYNQSSVNHLCCYTNFNLIKGDVRDKPLMTKLLKEADIIIPLAALVGAPICRKDPLNAESINKDAIFWMMDNISKEQKVIMPTTNSAYGTGDKNNHCTEESELRPISKYAIDKVEVEKRLLDHENSISYRLATVMGMSPRLRIDLLVNDFVYRALTDKYIVLFEGHFKRNYIHVRDVALAFIHGIDLFDKMKNNVYNVGLSEANLSKVELCEKIKEHIPDFVVKEAEIGKDPDQRNYIVSNEKIESTGYMPIYGLDKTIKELIKGLSVIRNNIHGNI